MPNDRSSKDRLSKDRKKQSKRKTGAQAKASPKSKSGVEPSRSMEGSGWISKRSGVIIIFLAGLILGVYAGTQTIPSLGLGEGLLWAVIIGGSIWFIGLGAYWLNRLLRPR